MQGTYVTLRTTFPCIINCQLSSSLIAFWGGHKHNSFLRIVETFAGCRRCQKHADNLQWLFWGLFLVQTLKYISVLCVRTRTWSIRLVQLSQTVRPHSIDLLFLRFSSTFIIKKSWNKSGKNPGNKKEFLKIDNFSKDIAFWFKFFAFYFFILSLSTLWNEAGKDMRNNKSVKPGLSRNY